MKQLDVRVKAALLTLGLVIMVALTVNYWPVSDGWQAADTTSLSEDTVTSSLFDSAVRDLRKRCYRRAIEGFRKLLETVPTMPEAYVNIGFAHLELKQYQLAKQAFDTALTLRSNQVNAYWGLAVSLEGICDIPAATGAMKTFVHLAKQDNPYLKKANAALWEWQQMKETAEHSSDNRIVCQ